MVEPIITQFKYNSLGELIELNLPDTSGQKKQLFFQYDQNGNETDRTSPQGFILKQRFDAMDLENRKPTTAGTAKTN